MCFFFCFFFSFFEISFREALEVLVSKLGDTAMSDVIAAEETSGPPNASATAGNASSPAAATSGGGSAHINRTIQQISQRYHSECKSTFDELTKVAQRVAACRRDVVAYDASQRQKAVKRSAGSSTAPNPMVALPTGIPCCYGCACAALDHCLTLLRAMATKPFLRRLMFEQGLLAELLHFNVSQGSSQSRCEVVTVMTWCSSVMIRCYATNVFVYF